MTRVAGRVLAALALWSGVFGMSGPRTAAAVVARGHAWDVRVLDQVLARAPRGSDTVVVGDMVMTRAMVEGARARLSRPGFGRPEGASGPGAVLWPGGVIPYNFDGTVSATHQQYFVDAASEWSAFGKVTFVPRTTQADYVTVHDDPSISGGNSFVGKKGGQQFVNIGSTSWNRYTLLHELGHTLGLVHEQQRADRDTYVVIQTANIIPGQEPNFAMLPGVSDIGPYDFFSVMHYARNALSKDPATLDTIDPQPTYASYLNVYGQQYDRPLSTGDRSAAQTLYGTAVPAPSATVTNTRDSGPGSLRAAMEYAFDTSDSVPASTTTVAFHIPTTDPGYNGSTFTIRPTATLPALGNRCVINGGSQTSFTGNTNSKGPEVVVNGANVLNADSNYASGFVFRGAASKVTKVVVNGFDRFGVDFVGSDSTSNALSGSYIGTDATGTSAAPNTYAAVELEAGAHGNTVGGTKASSANIISGSAAEGVRLQDAGTVANVVAGNTIGLGRTGAPLPNTYAGVAIFLGATANTIGGTKATAANVISGNANQGVAIVGAGSDSNVVTGNKIGTDRTGTVARANAYAGISVFGGARSNVIGGTAAGSGNLISGNANQGVTLSDAGTTSNKVQGNVIGLDATGSVALPNAYSGVAVFSGAAKNTIGGTTSAAANTISGNSQQGVVISDAGSNLNKVQGNRIGTNVAGTSAVGNTFSGLDIFGNAQSNTIGGTTAGSGNVISGNVGAGLTISGSTTKSNVVTGNAIGTNAAGSAVIANGSSGIALFNGARSNTIGGTAIGAGNRISGNGAYGVAISDASTTLNLLQGNVIGRLANGAAAPNGWDGVALWGGAHANSIGGSAAGAGNDISFNGGAGVILFDAATVGNAISANSMTGNTSLGINLVGGTEQGSGVTNNDATDADTGPNSLQNYPVLTSATNGASATTIVGTLTSRPSKTFTVELFASPTADPSQFGEGAALVGTLTVVTNASGTASINFTTSTLVTAGYVVTATATDAAGNTSEFSQRVVAG